MLSDFTCTRTVADVSGQSNMKLLTLAVTWVGYNQTAVLYDRAARSSGSTKFSTTKMLSFAFDGITSFSSQPLRIASQLGFFFSSLSLVVMLFLIYYALSGGPGLVQGWTSLIVSVLFLGGVQLIAIGLLGEYIGRIYEEVKQRPLYVVKDRLNLPVSGGTARKVSLHISKILVYHRNIYPTPFSPRPQVTFPLFPTSFLPS